MQRLTLVCDFLHKGMHISIYESRHKPEITHSIKKITLDAVFLDLENYRIGKRLVMIM